MRFINRFNSILARAVILIIIIIISQSCQKVQNPPPSSPDNTQNLKVSSTFDWKTSKDVVLSVTGMKEVNSNVGNTMYIKTLAGTVIFKDYLKMNRDYSIKFTVPSTGTSVTITYGTISKTLALTSGTISFNYITE